MKQSIQNYNHRVKVSYENYEDETFRCIPPDRIPKLADIVAAFTSGRPIDANLQRHLDYNDLEYNPVLEKGVDLADLGKIAKQVKRTKVQVQEELDKAKLAQSAKNAQAGAQVEPPAQVSTD